MLHAQTLRKGFFIYGRTVGNSLGRRLVVAPLYAVSRGLVYILPFSRTASYLEHLIALGSAGFLLVKPDGRCIALKSLVNNVGSRLDRERRLGPCDTISRLCIAGDASGIDRVLAASCHIPHLELLLSLIVPYAIAERCCKGCSLGTYLLPVLVGRENRIA